VNSFNFTFANGAQNQVPLVAQVSATYANFTTGAALFETACIPQNVSSSAKPESSSGTSVATPLNAPKNYPAPVVRDQYNLLVGYYLEDPGMADVAVMSVPTFDTSGPLLDGTIPISGTADFADEAQQFVRKAPQMGNRRSLST
jgi:hypothetical protein